MSMLQRSTITAALAAIVLAGAAPPAPAERETLRCSGLLIERGDPMAKVAALCGEPDRKQVERVPIRGRSAEGASIKLGVTTLEHWTYERGGRFPARITFEASRVERIELLTGP